MKELTLAVTQEYNETFKANDHYAYLINPTDKDLDTVLILSHGSEGDQQTSKMRHRIDRLPAHSIAKVELIQEEVLKLKNTFHVTYFEGQKLHTKDFVLEKGALKEGALRRIKELDKRGILIK